MPIEEAKALKEETLQTSIRMKIFCKRRKEKFIFSKLLSKLRKMRIHLVPQGLPEDKNLIINGIVQSNGEQVFIIRNSETKLPRVERRVAECIKDICEEIEKNKQWFWFIKKVDYKTISVNFFDFLEALGSLDRFIRKEIEAGNDVSVNISTGNKVVSLALAMAALKHRAKIYYFVPQDIKNIENENLETNEEENALKRSPEFIEIPLFPLDYMKNVDYNILRAVSKSGGKIGSITELVKVLHPNISGKQLVSKRVEISSRIRQLESLGYVKTVPKGNQRQVSLTQNGMKILRFVAEK